MYCPNCKKAFPDGHAFCDSCGSKLVNEHASPAPQASYQPAQNYNPQPVPNNNPQPAPNYNPQPAPNYYPQPAYPAPAYGSPGMAPGSEPVSTGAWFGIAFLNVVPFFVGLVYVITLILGTIQNLENVSFLSVIFVLLSVVYIILLFVWAFGSTKKRSLKNYARATLIMALILIVLSIIAYFALKDYLYENFGIDFTNLFNIYGGYGG